MTGGAKWSCASSTVVRPATATRNARPSDRHFGDARGEVISNRGARVPLQKLARQRSQPSMLTAWGWARGRMELLCIDELRRPNGVDVRYAQAHARGECHGEEAEVRPKVRRAIASSQKLASEKCLAAAACADLRRLRRAARYAQQRGAVVLEARLCTPRNALHRAARQHTSFPSATKRSYRR